MIHLQIKRQINLSQRHIDIIRYRYEHSYKITCDYLDENEHDYKKRKDRKRKAYALTRGFFNEELIIRSETRDMIREDILSHSLRNAPLVVKKKKKRKKKKKNYCTCAPVDKMCFCRDNKGNYVR